MVSTRSQLVNILPCLTLPTRQLHGISRYSITSRLSSASHTKKERDSPLKESINHPSLTSVHHLLFKLAPPLLHLYLHHSPFLVSLPFCYIVHFRLYCHHLFPTSLFIGVTPSILWSLCSLYFSSSGSNTWWANKRKWPRGVKIWTPK